MCQDVPHVNAVLLEIDYDDQPILVTAHVEDDERPYQIGLWKVGADICEIGPSRFPNVFKPAIEWPLRIRMRYPKVS
jgi:hypothetical protein